MPNEDKVVDIKASSQSAHRRSKSMLEEAKDSLINKRIEKRYAVGVEPEKRGDAAPGKSNAQSEDPWSTLAAEGKIIEPPFDILSLSMLREQSSELGQCVEAMEANIEKLGHRQVPRVKIDDEKIEIPETLLKEIKKESIFLTNFFEYCTYESFTEFRTKLRHDLELTGNRYFEVIRDAKGKIQQFVHLPSYQMRLTRLDDNPVQVERRIMKMQEDNSVEIDTITEWRRFRRYVQGRVGARPHSAGGSQGISRTWFKSFGDPRRMSKTDGRYEDDIDGNKIKDSDLATEVVHDSIYSGRSPYGLPRFVGNLLSIYGDRASEEINYTTFRNNNVPSMMILVSGGQLTDGTVKRLESFVESQIQGSDNYSKFVIVEAESVSDEGEDNGQARITVERMVKDQHNDALFQQYSKNNQDKIRRCFRLPPLLVGRAEDYTRTTAESSRRVADEQVFTPERNDFDDFWNRIIYPEMGIRFHKFKTNSPTTTDNESLVKILAGAEKTGGLTPRIARKILETVLSMELGGFEDDFNPDVPFSMTIAEAVKNQADPTEPGQQVTAMKRVLKIMKAIMGDDAVPDGIPDGVEDPIVYVTKFMNEKLEKSWQEEVKAD